MFLASEMTFCFHPKGQMTWVTSHLELGTNSLAEDIGDAYVVNRNLLNFEVMLYSSSLGFS